MTPSPEARTRVPRHSAPYGARWRSAIVAAPERLVLIVVVLALAAGTAVSVGQHHWWTVLPLAALGIAVAWRPLAPRLAPVTADAAGAAVALGGTLAWAVLGMAQSAEYLLVVRDPGFLTLSGLWLVDHPSTDIPIAGADEAAALQSSALADAPEAWNLKGDVIQPQGAKLLPATIAIGGWVAGESGVLSANVVIGAVGILAVYCVARRFLGPLAALAPAGALAATVSHIGLSRPAYTEPLTLLLLMAALLWLWRGVREQSLPLVLAGAVAGSATAFIRIDGALFSLGLVVGAGAALALARADRAWRARAAIAMSVTSIVVTLAGYLALAYWSTEYLERLGPRTGALVAGFVAVAVVVALWACTWPAPLRGDRALSVVRDARSRTAAIALGAAVTIALTVLATRPLWMVSRRGTTSDEDRFANGVIESFQAAQGLPIDGTRTYAESTVTWLAYYLTWPLVALGILGLGWATYQALRKDAGWALLVGAVLVPSALYLWRPAIVADQIWAIRRFEPATLPGWLLAAAAAAWALASLPRSATVQRSLRTASAALVVGLPFTTWVSLAPGDAFPVSTAVNVTTREMAGARDQLHALCDAAPGRPIVLVGTSEHFGGLRILCDQPVVLALGDPTRANLLAMSQVWGTAPVVLTRSADAVPWTASPTVIVDSEVTHSAYTLQAVPRTVYERNYRWYAGIVTDQGEVEPVSTVPVAREG